MALTKSILTGRVVLPTDAAPINAELVFTLSGLDSEGGDILPPGDPARCVLVNGELPSGYSIWRNTEGYRGTHYIVTVMWTDMTRQGIRETIRELGKIQVGDNASYVLADLLAEGTVPAGETFWSAITEAEYQAAIYAWRKSKAWAESPTPPDPLDLNSKSSKTWAAAAADSAVSAATLIGDAMLGANNLSDVDSAPTARTNLGVIAANIPYTASVGVNRMVSARLSDELSIFDFGGVGNGATSNNTAGLAAAANGDDIFLPRGLFASTLTLAQIPKRLRGVGKLKDTLGYRAPNFVRQDAAPASFGAPDDINTRFNGDLSNVLFTGEKRVTAAGAFGTPATGYTQFLENSMLHLSVLNYAGHNQSTSGNDGRTGSSILDLRFQHNGQGDYGALHISGLVAGAKAGATSFLANPAAVMMNGDLFAAANGAYLNILELNADDLGFRAAAIGCVFNFKRTVAAASLGEVWMGVRPQSSNLASDVGYSLGGLWKRGLDLSAATLDGNAAAITLKQGQRIYFGSTPSGNVPWSQTLGAAYTYFDGSSIVNSVGGAFPHQVNANDVVINSGNGLLLAGTGTLQMSGSNQFSTGVRTATFTATNKPGATNSAPTQWLKIKLNGFFFWIPCFPD